MSETIDPKTLANAANVLDPKKASRSWNKIIGIILTGGLLALGGLILNKLRTQSIVKRASSFVTKNNPLNMGGLK